MKTIIAGSRSLGLPEVIQAMNECPFLLSVSEVVSGCAVGVDLAGEEWAELHGLPVKKFPADWERHGRGAGPLRNLEMAKYADCLVAVWDSKSRGTKDMIAKARKLGLKVSVWTQ